MSENIEVTCAVCGKHMVKVPARPGIYRVKCPNASDLDIRWSYSSTVVKVNEDGSVSSRQGSPD